ncbi:hypothetical protein RAS2_09700 [Phycisphaerae bacterium RAS2]|nr:hypothetical protein RAS2_09700 [Phycisphaerae bacterium RAS2]
MMGVKKSLIGVVFCGGCLASSNGYGHNDGWIRLVLTFLARVAV